MDWIQPLAVALAVYCVPVWGLTEVAAVFFAAKGWKASAYGQLALRCIPFFIALAMVELSPSILAAIIEGLWDRTMTELGHGELAVFALIASAAAVQLHQWRIPQAIGVVVVSTVRRIGTDPTLKVAPPPPPSEEEPPS